MHFHILSCSSSYFNCSLSSVKEAQVQGSGTERLNSSHHFLSSQDAAVCFISSKTLLLSFFQSFNASGYRTPIRITNIANATALSLVQLHLLFHYVSFQDSFHCLLFDLAYLFYIYSKSFDML